MFFNLYNVVPGLTRNLFQRKNVEGEIPGQARYDNFVGGGNVKLGWLYKEKRHFNKRIVIRVT